MEQHLRELSSRNKWNGRGDSLKDLKSIPSVTDDNSSSGFDCNICLDLVEDPVVTFCGHLYCWPCIFKWIRFCVASQQNLDEHHPRCPVCKAEVSSETLVPIYGRGRTMNSPKGKGRRLGISIPPAQELLRRTPPQQHGGDYVASPVLNLGGTTTASVFHPMIGMFAEIVNGRTFGDSGANLYAYPTSYHLAGSSSPRMPRRVMQADKSLSRICFFLCCCLILCLFLF